MLKRALQRTLLVAAGLVFVLLALEATARIAIYTTRGHRFSAQEYRAAMATHARATEQRANRAAPGEYSVGVHEVIHPYLGFVPDPAALPDQASIDDPRRIPAPSDGRLVVGIFGGSFAAGVCHWAGAELRRVLARPDKVVDLFCAAAGGYKQPQQFLELAYLLAQGARFDLVINLDGFNEVALPLENIPQHVAPIYPRSWFWRIGNVADPGALKLLGQLSTSDRSRQAWADTCVRWRCDRSALLSSAWQKVDGRFGSRRDALLAAIQGYKVEQKKSYAFTGPAMTFPDEPTLYAYLARVWKDSSLQMKALCDANHTKYAHFLQPNQHVEGSKPIAAQEARFVTRYGPYPKAGKHGYPVLRQQGEELGRAGVDFHDLTMVFKDVPEPLYSDGCCHLVPSGYVRIARVIGDTLRAGGDGFVADPPVPSDR